MSRVDTDEDYEGNEVAVAEDATDTEATEYDNTDNTEDGNEQDADSAAATATEQATEAPAQAETEAQPEGPTEEEIKAAVLGFIEAVKAEVKDDAEGRDPSTGTLSAEQVSRVRTKYSELPAGKARTSAKQYLDEKMREAMDKMEVPAARSYLQLKDNATKVSGGTATAVRKPVDPTDALVAQVVPLILAPMVVETPEGVAADWEDRVTNQARELQPQLATYAEYLAELKKFGETEQPEGAEAPKEPEVHDLVKAAFRIGRGRVPTAKRAKAAGSGEGRQSTPRVSDGTRRNILAHISNAFTGKASGDFLLISEIVNTQSSEYGNDKPSQGAVAARLFKKDGAGNDVPQRFENDGFEGAVNENGKKGARKL